jgi:hypothetical protein
MWPLRKFREGRMGTACLGPFGGVDRRERMSLVLHQLLRLLSRREEPDLREPLL